MVGATRRSPPRSRPSPMDSRSRPSPVEPRPQPSPEDDTEPQPRRPANAWILYRSDKLRQMMRVRLAKGLPKMAQSDVSKECAEMWKYERPEVRAEYERLADMRKAEHAAAHPNYKFKPKKKEEKVRIRELKKAKQAREREEAKLNKTRHAAYSQSYLPMVHTPYYRPESPYAPGGPSPPLSGASSPSSTPSPSSSSSEIAADYYHASQVREPSPLASSSMPPPCATPDVGPTSRHSSYSGLSIPNTIQETSSQQFDALAQDGWSMPPQMLNLNHAGPSEAGPSNQWVFPAPQDAQQPELDISQWISFDLPTFDIPQLPVDNNMDESALAAATMLTGGPNVWQLSGLDASSFVSTPPGEIDLLMGAMGHHATQDQDQIQQDQFAQLLADFDFTQLPGQPSLFPPEPLPQDLFDMLQAEDDRPRSVTQDSFLQFLNLDNGMSHSQTMPVAPVASSSASSGGSYVPPSGAANASKRRVAGSWRPPAEYLSIPDSPIEHSQPLWAN